MPTVDIYILMDRPVRIVGGWLVLGTTELFAIVGGRNQACEGQVRAKVSNRETTGMPGKHHRRAKLRRHAACGRSWTRSTVPSHAASLPPWSASSGISTWPRSVARGVQGALEQRPRGSVPDNPRAWLVSTGRFKAIDGLRRRARIRESAKRRSRLNQGCVIGGPAPSAPGHLSAPRILPRSLHLPT